MTNLLVTGGSGFIGREVVNVAKSYGHNVAVLDRVKPSFPVDFYKADITSSLSLEDAIKYLEDRMDCRFDAMIHLAALFNYSAPFKDLYNVNVKGTEKVADISIKLGLEKFVQLGAAASYGDSYDVPVKEDFPLKPTEAYGRTKMLAEEALFERALELKAVTLRAPIVYGKNTKGTYIDALFKGAKGPLIMPRKITSNSYVHAYDLARACILAINDEGLFKSNPKELSDYAYNVADDEVLNEKQVMESLAFCLTGKEKKALPILPSPLIKIAAFASDLIEIKLLRKNRSTLPRDMVKHASSNHLLNNAKLKQAIDFTYLYKNIKEGFPEVIND